MKTNSITHLSLLGSEAAPSSETITLPSGRRVEVGIDEEKVAIRNPEGRVELTVRCTPDGCVLEFESANLALTNPGKIAIACEELSVATGKRLSLQTEGDMNTEVSGDSTTRVAGRLETQADELFLQAKRGDAIMKANDFVRLNGEQIMLNSEDDPREQRKRLEAFLKALSRPKIVKK